MKKVSARKSFVPANEMPFYDGVNPFIEVARVPPFLNHQVINYDYLTFIDKTILQYILPKIEI